MELNKHNVECLFGHHVYYQVKDRTNPDFDYEQCKYCHHTRKWRRLHKIVDFECASNHYSTNEQYVTIFSKLGRE